MPLILLSLTEIAVAGYGGTLCLLHLKEIPFLFSRCQEFGIITVVSTSHEPFALRATKDVSVYCWDRHADDILSFREESLCM